MEASRAFPPVPYGSTWTALGRVELSAAIWPGETQTVRVELRDQAGPLDPATAVAALVLPWNASADPWDPAPVDVAMTREQAGVYTVTVTAPTSGAWANWRATDPRPGLAHDSAGRLIPQGFVYVATCTFTGAADAPIAKTMSIAVTR